MSHIQYYGKPVEYTHDVKTYYDEGLGPDEVELHIPTYKKALCGDNLLGNAFYPLWRNLDCPCCALWRGIVTGVVLTTLVHGIVNMVF